jgi:hypothetical protein
MNIIIIIIFFLKKEKIPFQFHRFTPENHLISASHSPFVFWLMFRSTDAYRD